MAREIKQALPFNWPLDDEGNPKALISMQVSELIPTAKYANVTIGPIVVTRFVNDDQVVGELSNSAEEVEESLGVERAKVFKSLEE